MIRRYYLKKSIRFSGGSQVTWSFFLISFIASTLGAVSGIGGGVIIKPSLDIFSNLSVASISFLSGSTVLSMTIVTLLRNRKSETVLDKKVSTLLALGGIIGGLAGKYLFDLALQLFSGEAAVGILQSLLLAVMVLLVLLFILRRDSITPRHFTNKLLIIATGFFLGGLASFIGIGGGPINIALLYLFFSMDAKKAALNSIFIIFLSQLSSLLFTVAGGNIPPFEIGILLLMILGGVSGGFVGAAITRRATLKGVDYIFSFVLLVIFALSILQIVRLSS